MEWWIIVPVLCLIGILHVPGNAAQNNNTNSTNTTTAGVTTNQTALTNQATNISQPATTNQTATTNQATNTSQPATANQTATTNQATNTSQPATANQTATTNQATNTSQPATTNQTATTNQATNTSQTAATNQTATTNQTTTPTTTVSTPATTPAKTASLNLMFSLVQTFKDVYSNQNDPETKQLADQITSAFSPAYKKKFKNFISMKIRKFSKGSIVTDSVLEFDNTNNTTPNVTEVKDTFTEAIQNGNFNFTVDNTTINVTDITANVSTTTIVSTTAVSTTAVSTIAVSTTAVSTTAVSTAAGMNLSEYNVTFKMNETFSSELSNISSSRAVALAKNITDQFDGVLKKRFSNFVRTFIWRFRNGSIIVDALLGFNKTGTSPTASEVAKVIADSAKNGSFTFTVDTLTVTDPLGTTANRSPVLASMLTALWMTLASLVVSAVMH